ncbi:MAG TPA: prohibitin family protein [Verrucomicrobiae bacterium]|jgi:prohibitin 2|nr:prohibitin family protein [Verrucomicrobiae bacterium]
MRAQTIARLIGVAIIIFVVVIAASTSTYVVQPGYRGIEVTLGKVSPVFKPEGFGVKTPFITTIVPILIRQQTREVAAPCYSADLQQVNMDLRVLYRIPEASVVKIYQGYAGDPFDSLIAPRVQEALKEVSAMQSAEQIVKNREEIKSKALAGARLKVGDLLVIEDLVIQNIDLTKDLETAIEAKMVQEQEAAKAKFTQQKAQIEADTVVIKAKGDAESIRIRGEALKQTPAFIDLQIVEKWDGKAPLVVNGTGGGSANILLPLSDLEKKRNASTSP